MQHCLIEGSIAKHGVKISETGKGNNVATFELCVVTGWGKYKKKDYFKCIAWGQVGDMIAKNFKPYDVILLDGEMHNSPYKKDDRGFDIPNWQFVIARVFFPQKSFNDNQDASANPAQNFDSSNAFAGDFAVIEDGEDLPF